VFCLAITYIIFALLVTMATHAPGLGNLLPHWILQAFDPNDKTNLAPYRVVHLMALAIVVTRFVPADSPIQQWRALTPLIKCGQNSLQVFCIGIVLSFCAHVAIEMSLNSLWVQIFVGVTGILFMTASAYMWSKRQHRVLLSRTRIRPMYRDMKSAEQNPMRVGSDWHTGRKPGPAFLGWIFRGGIA